MSVNNGQAVSAEVTNAAFISRLVDSDTVGQLGLQKPTGSGQTIDDLQKLQTTLMENIGMADETVDELEYTSNNFVADGQSLVAAVSTLDDALADEAAARDAADDDLQNQIDDIETDVTNLQTDVAQAQMDIIDLAAAGGGGGGGAGDWYPVAGLAPFIDYSKSVKMINFSSGLLQTAERMENVPSAFVGGIPIKMGVTVFSPSASDKFKFEVRTFLISLVGGYPITSTAHFTTVNSGDITNSGGGDLPHRLEFQLTDGTGKIDGVSVAADDFLRIQITRVNASTAEDISDVTLIPSTTRMVFT